VVGDGWPDPLHAVLLVAAGVAAGFVNTLAGGGSLVSVPALMLLGLPAGVANASSRVAVWVGSATGALSYTRAGRVAGADVIDVVPMTVLGALGGAYVATIIPNEVFKPLLLGTMALMAVALLWRPEALAPPPGTTPLRAGGRPIALLALFAAGFYGGILQAGVGLVLIAVLAGLLRHDLVRANGLKVVIVMVYSTVALAVFVARGKVAWTPALVLAAGNVVGAQIGVKFAISRGQEAIKRVLLVMVVVTCVMILLK
jgi:uncharacterized protein